MAAEVLDGPRRELFGYGAVYTAASAAQALSVVLVLPVATRLLSPADFGTVAVALVVLQFLGLAATWGIPSVVMLEYLRRDREDGPQRARRLVGTTLVLAAVLAGVVDLTGPLWSRAFASIGYGTELRLAVWGAVPLAVVASAQSILRSARRPVAFVAVAGLSTLGAQALGAGLVWHTDGGATAYLVGMVVAATIGAVTALALVGPSRPDWSRDLGRAAMRTGLPLVPHSLALFALLAADRVVIERILGLAAAGRYQVAYLVGAGVLSLVSAVNNAWSPIVLGAEDDRRWSILAGTTRDLERAVVLVVGLVAVLSPFALAVAAPSGYGVDALLPVTVIVASSALAYLWYLSGVHVVLFHRRTVVLAVVTPSVALIAVTANLRLLEPWGTTAAAVVTVGSYLLLALLVRMAANRMATVPWHRAASFQAAAAVVALAAVALLLPATGPWTLLRPAAVALLCVPALRLVVPRLLVRPAAAT
jgi:O-antigen/teichoic acid export membrane protein